MGLRMLSGSTSQMGIYLRVSVAEGAALDVLPAQPHMVACIKHQQVAAELIDALAGQEAPPATSSPKDSRGEKDVHRHWHWHCHRHASYPITPPAAPLPRKLMHHCDPVPLEKQIIMAICRAHPLR